MDSVEPPIAAINSDVAGVKHEPSSPSPEADKNHKVEISVNQTESIVRTRVCKRMEQWQRDALCDAFAKNPYPKSYEIQKLAAQVKRTEDQIRSWFTVRRKTQGIRKTRSTVSNEFSQDAAEEQLILFPDLQSVIPQLRQLIMKFPYQVETKTPIWSKALNADEDRVKTWINWLGEQRPSVPSLSRNVSVPTDTPSTGRPAVVVPQLETRLPTPSESPEPQRLSFGSSSDNTEHSPLFSNPFASPSSPFPPSLTTSPVEPMSQISGPSKLSGKAPIQSSPVERHVPSELRKVSEPVSPVTAVPVAQLRRVTVPDVSRPIQYATSSTLRDYAPTSAMVPSQSLRFIHVSRPTQAAAQPGNGSIDHSAPATQNAPITSSTVRDSRRQTSIPETSSTAPFPPFRIPERRPSVQVHQDADPESGLDHLHKVSVSSHVLPSRIRSFDAFRHFVRDHQLMNIAAPSSSSSGPSSDSPESLRQLEGLGPTASEVLLRMRS